MDDLAHDLATFITAAPTPYHAVAEAVRRLEEAGFVEQSETGPWLDGPGGRYLVRDGTFAAWVQGAAPRPLRVYLAHTDSPTLKVKPHPDTGRAGWRQVGVEVYGGALWNSWLDRDLGLAGRLALYDGSVVLVDVARPLLRVPQLAIHLDRAVNQGLTLDAQQHLLPIWGLGAPAEGDLVEFLAGEAGVDADEIAAHDLVVHDLTPPARLGEEEELLAAPRLDNLASVHAGLAALVAVDADVTPVLIGFDHEEIGSATATGAAGPLLENLLTRLAGRLRRPRPGVRRVALPLGGRHARRPPQLPRTPRPRAPHAAEPGARAEGQRDPALRHRRPRRRGLVPRVPHRRRPDAGVRREEHDAVRLDGRADHRDPARHPHGRRRHPGAVHALRPGAVRGGRSGFPRRRGHGVPQRPALTPVCRSSV